MQYYRNIPTRIRIGSVGFLRLSASSSAAGDGSALRRRCGARNCDGRVAMKRCSACRLIFYCSKACQREDWKFGQHAIECKQLKCTPEHEQLLKVHWEYGTPWLDHVASCSRWYRKGQVDAHCWLEMEDGSILDVVYIDQYLKCAHYNGATLTSSRLESCLDTKQPLPPFVRHAAGPEGHDHVWILDPTSRFNADEMVRQFGLKYLPASDAVSWRLFEHWMRRMDRVLTLALRHSLTSYRAASGDSELDSAQFATKDMIQEERPRIKWQIVQHTIRPDKDEDVLCTHHAVTDLAEDARRICGLSDELWKSMVSDEVILIRRDISLPVEANQNTA